MVTRTIIGYRYVYKSAVTGKIVTESYAWSNPTTTYREKVPVYNN